MELTALRWWRGMWAAIFARARRRLHRRSSAPAILLLILVLIGRRLRAFTATQRRRRHELRDRDDLGDGVFVQEIQAEEKRHVVCHQALYGLGPQGSLSVELDEDIVGQGVYSHEATGDFGRSDHKSRPGDARRGENVVAHLSLKAT